MSKLKWVNPNLKNLGVSCTEELFISIPQQYGKCDKKDCTLIDDAEDNWKTCLNKTGEEWAGGANRCKLKPVDNGGSGGNDGGLGS